jgi:hypothetical protein
LQTDQRLRLIDMTGLVCGDPAANTGHRS